MPFIKNVLILAVNPKDTQQLDLTQEVQGIEKILEGGMQNVTFDVEVKMNIQPSEVLNAIRDHKPQIIHFCGHGEGFELAFADENQFFKSVKGNSLLRLFSDSYIKRHLECVVLNACYSAEQALWVSRVVDYSIGNLYSIKDKSAIQFSKLFYSAIVADKTVSSNVIAHNAFEVAFNNTKITMALDNIKERELLTLHKRRLIPSLEPDIERLLLNAGIQYLVTEILRANSSKSNAQLGRASVVEHDVLKKLRKILQSLPGLKKYHGDVYSEAWEDLWNEIKDKLSDMARANIELDADEIVKFMNDELEAKMKKYQRSIHRFMPRFSLW